MKTLTTSVLVIAALLVAAVPAQAAKAVNYKGKTAAGHKITFTVKRGKVYKAISAVPTVCLPIQGGGRSTTTAELWDARGWWIYANRQGMKFTEMKKPSGYWNEVTMNHEFSSKKAANGTMRGKLRLQFSYLVPKYIPGTFSIYSCLGTTTFKARPIR